ncbi:flocculation protein FLO11-like [Anopheles albimanus]|uniref:Uncharacterized protein n=1 Tax=Anopheles albimanus TaxID=7167 RepID=A0A182FUL0_ANOAL|nr:flocculation protein FLO11-like [Anopheles albimanus]
MGKDIDPADIGKHADLIKKAQADISSTDVLVCGRCNTVFHLLELFRAHKENEPNCRRAATSVQDCDEAQAKVWAFLLWKSAQRSLTMASDGDKPNHNNSWKLYQTWVKLDESVRDTWIVAGKTIQSFARIGSGNLQEMPVKITKTILETSADGADKKLGTPGSVNRVAPQLRKPGEPLTTRPALSTLDPKRGTVTGTPIKTENSPKTPVKRAVAKRTTPETKVITEEEVEKILAKRFSPLIKMHEYLVKWSKRNNDENTWEPLTHLNSCQGMLEFFEKQLAKQKEQRAATAARTLQQQRQDKNKLAGTLGTTTAATASTPTTVVPKGSPRSAKATAIDRVKLWTSGSRSPGDADGTDGENKAGGLVKRKLNDSDADNNDSSQDGLGKRARTDVTEALSKVSQSSSVKIVPISGATAGKVTVNGASGGAGADGTLKDGNAAEVVIKSPRDATIPSGITKKPGTVGTPTSISPRGEAKVKIVNRSEAAGTHGISKIGDSPTAQSATASSATSGAAVSSSITRTVPISTSTSNTTGGDVTTRFVRRNVDGTPQLFKQTIRKATKIVSTTPTAAGTGTATVQRPAGVLTAGGVRTVTNNASVTGTGVQKTTTVVGGAQTRTTLTPRGVSTGTVTTVNRTGVTTVKTPPGVVRTGISAAATASSEDKINALRKQGLNVVKRPLGGTPGTAASPAVSSVKKLPTKSASIKNDEEDDEMNDGFPGNLPLPAPPSPPRALTLCPVTGKVLSQAEGEPTPVPSPDEAEAADEKKEEESKHGEQQQQLTEQQLEVDQMLASEDGSAFLVASEDGTLYRVAGKNADGQTILIPHGGGDGQSCLLMAPQEGEDEAANGGSSGVLTLNSAISEAVAMPQEEGQPMMEEQEVQMQMVGNQQLTIQTEDSQDGQITAEIVQAGAPSPGGTRRVVLMLPNGSLMMTEVTDEQYQSLNLTNPTEE